MTTLAAYVETLPAIPGFAGEWQRADYSDEQIYVLENKETEIRFKFNPHGSGTTEFNTPMGWKTFDRLGVEDSFYWTPLWEGDKCPEPQVLIDTQLARIAKSREFFKTAVSVPHIPFTVSPAAIPEYKKRLEQSGTITFSPSGFGTGYTLRTRPSRFAKRAHPETEKFFGKAPLYVSTFDAD